MIGVQRLTESYKYNEQMQIITCKTCPSPSHVYLQSDDGVQVKWYNPMTWNMLKPKGINGDFQGEGLRGGISSVRTKLA